MLKAELSKTRKFLVFIMVLLSSLRSITPFYSKGVSMETVDFVFASAYTLPSIIFLLLAITTYHTGIISSLNSRITNIENEFKLIKR